MKRSSAVIVALAGMMACGSTSSTGTPPTTTDPTPNPTPTPTPSPTPAPEPQAALNVEVQGQGQVDVLSQQGTQKCQGSCTQQVNQGSTVSLVPHPADGFSFSGFQGNLCNGSNVAGSNDCNLIVNGNLTIIVVFVAIPTPPPSKHTLVVNRTGNGVCEVVATAVGLDCGTDCQKECDADADVVLAVQPDKDSAFTGWKGGPCDGSRDTTCTVHMDKDVTVSARCMKIVCSVDP